MPVAFTVIRELGRGSFGTVHLVRRDDGSEFAMKCIPLHCVPQEEHDLAVTEINLLQRLYHPGIVRYVEAVVLESELRIVMEYCSSGDLLRWANRLPSRRFPVSAAVPLALSMLQALDYLHNYKRIVHRDIKPENILVTAAGVPKLGACAQLLLCAPVQSQSFLFAADFGVSRAATSTLSLRTCTGTLPYMAPEIALLEDDAETIAAIDAGYTFKADVWSLGATLFKLVTGKPPLETKGALKRIAHNPSSWHMPGLPPGTPPAAATLLAAMLVADPNDRPSVASLLGSPILAGVEEFSAAIAMGRHVTDTSSSAVTPQNSLMQAHYVIPPPPSNPAVTRGTSSSAEPTLYDPEPTIYDDVEEAATSDSNTESHDEHDDTDTRAHTEDNDDNDNEIRNHWQIQDALASTQNTLRNRRHVARAVSQRHRTTQESQHSKAKPGEYVVDVIFFVLLLAIALYQRLVDIDDPRSFVCKLRR